MLKTTKKWGIYILFQNLPVGSWKRARMPFRSTGQRLKIWPLSPPVDRPVDRARSREQLLSRRSTIRSTVLETKSKALCQVDHPVDRRLSREQSSLVVDRLGRPASPAWLHAHSVHVGRPARSTGSQPVWHFWDRKTWVFICQINPIKFLKIYKNKFLYSLWNTNLFE